MSDTQIKRVKVSEILKDLKSGVTRWKKEDLGFGSIEEKYNLTFSEMKLLVNHTKIKGVRVTVPSLIIEDDTETEEDIVIPGTNNSSEVRLEEVKITSEHRNITPTIVEVKEEVKLEKTFI